MNSWLALALAFSFGIYGYLRKTLPVSSAGGLFAETAVLFPLAAGYIAYWVAVNGAGPHLDPWQLFLLALTGLASVASLVAFAYGAQRLPLTVLGMFQYIAPSLQFLLAVSVLGEAINPTRLFSFGLIWVLILIFTWDSLRRRGRTRLARPAGWRRVTDGRAICIKSRAGPSAARARRGLSCPVTAIRPKDQPCLTSMRCRPSSAPFPASVR